MSATISARRLLGPDGWMTNAAVRFGDDGRIVSVGAEGFDPATAVGTLLPGMANVHTHSFQRAMAGLAEQRGPSGSDDFWTWRQVMYRFLDLLTPEDIEAIAAQVQMDMAEAGYTASAEFHYLHHRPNGAHYDDLAETSARILAASQDSGIGLTHLPVLYTYGGLDQRKLGDGQRRFGCDIATFERLYAALQTRATELPADFRLGIAPHSLRAVDRAGLDACLALCPDGPIHIHAAEQIKEVEEVEAHLGARPVRWLLDNLPVDARWCLIHATHLDDPEVQGLAASRAVAGLCPTTEANLGDGIFPAVEYLIVGGRFGIGSDSNIRLSVAEELRALETSQRLKHRQRTLLTEPDAPSNGRHLYRRAASGGAQAIGRDAGEIAIGKLADFVALRDDVPFLDWPEPDQCLDAWIFGLEEPAVSDVWSAGRHIVRAGLHVRREAIRARFATTMRKLRDAL
ncbi:formimidoylglutamate deiminase [Altererythrobacter arenosus]|uniref:Formimidoylglutamate deiminase n=1 Tax=Altererythrobacter arenosus TaxID=3032592 RepID=A0ABY8FN07_9SPHN|nr:formimidoylglutamate deiminase [Altererythrobacter sp. CAU 1644]WFL76408.1 formimidoylglutamate deiminase [Altererythrobacter sp. CAU 1644]